MSEQIPKRPAVSQKFLLVAATGLTFGLFILIAVPNFIKAHSRPCTNSCINSLRQIDCAAYQFALEKGLTNGQPIHFPNDLTPYIKLNSAGSIPPCPDGGVYHLSKVGETPTCTMSTLTPAHALQ